MSTQTEATSVRASIVVEAPIEQAFRVFTNDFGSFKPPEHNLLGVEIAETVFEPPGRVVLSWDISPYWQLETDPEKTSQWEVSFLSETPQRTRSNWSTGRRPSRRGLGRRSRGRRR
jgi:hypothetical protein